MVFRTAPCVFFILSSVAFAGTKETRPVFGAHPGYLFNVVEEKDRREVEMVMLDRPKENKKPLSEVIFDEKLSKEFQDQYRYRFGETQAEQVINNPGRSDEYTYYNRNNLTAVEYQKYQRQFGDYMMRRLVEYHFDNWAKKSPEFRPVYQMKDRISNLDVQVKKGYKVKWRYNFAGPSMNVDVENPYDIETRVQIMMNGVISAPKDIIFTLGYQATPRIKLESLYKQYEQLVQFVVSRKMTTHVNMSLTGSSGQVPDLPEFHQDLVLVGLSWNE
jgi:hypothetical protein